VSLLDLISPAPTEADAPELYAEMRVAPVVRNAGPPRLIYERTSALLI
jgi:hypothetical protein